MFDLSRTVIEAVEGGRNSWITLLQGLVNAQRGGENAVQKLVGDALRLAGAQIELSTYMPREVPLMGEFASEGILNDQPRVNLLARVAGSGGGRDLILFGHPDSEPVPETPGWSHDPFGGSVQDGKLFGWGVADDLAGIAAGVAALQALKSINLQLAGSVTLASTPSKQHARGVAAALAGGLTAEAALYLHPAESGAGLTEIKAFAGGQIEFRITVKGRKPDTTEPGHTAFAHLAVNPIDKAFVIYAALKDLDQRRARIVHHPLLDAAVGRSTNLQVSQIHCGSGPRTTRLADTCSLGGAISFPPSELLADVQKAIVDTVREAAASDEWLAANEPTLEWRSGISPAETPTSHPFYLTASEAIQRVTGEVPHVNPLHTASDIRNPILQQGIPTIGLGSRAGNLTQSGFVDEWIDVEDYINMVKVIALTVVDWMGIANAR